MIKVILGGGVEAFRQHVQQHAADEIGRGECHCRIARSAVDAVVLDAERPAIRPKLPIFVQHTPAEAGCSLALAEVTGLRCRP